MVPAHRLVTMLAATIFFVGSFMLVPCCCPRASAAGRPVADADLPHPAARRHLQGQLCRGRAGARHRRGQSACEAGAPPSAAAKAGSDPFAPAGRGRGAQGDADPEPDAAPGAPGRHQAGYRGPVARGAERDSRGADQGRPGSANEKYILVLASENGPLLSEHARVVDASCAASRASAT